MAKSVGIVGGGITGLSAAYALAKLGHSVTLFERDAALGGLAGSFRVGGEYLEKFYHHIFLSETRIQGLLGEIGLGGRLVWLPDRTGVYYANSIYRLSSPLDLLKFKPLPLIDRVRMGIGAWRMRRISDWKALDRISARDFIEEYMGGTVYRVVWEPLFRSKFGPDADRISAAWLWTKLRARTERGGKKRGGSMGYLQGGFGLMFDELERRVVSLGGRILKSSPAERIEAGEGSARAVVSGGKRHEFDAVLCTTAIPIFLKLAPDLPADYSERLARIRYQGTVCLVLKLKRPLSRTYWLNVNDPDMPFVAVVEHTNLGLRSDYGGVHLAYVSRYLERGHRLYSLSEGELLDEYCPHLSRMFPAFRRDWVLEARLWKEDYTQPVATVGYSEAIPGHRAPVPGLYLATMAQVYPFDRGMNYGIEIADRAVRDMETDWSFQPKEAA